MKFAEFNISNKDGKSNCVIRSLCKVFNNSYDDVYNELLDICNKINASSFNDVEVFEEYMMIRNTKAIDYGKDMLIKDLKLDNGNYLVLCWDKKDFYHMVPIMDNTLYDKDNRSLDLYVIKIYKESVIL